MTKQATLGFILIAGLASAQADDWRPDIKTIAVVDKAVLQLPQPANLPSLAAYSRYYMGSNDEPNVFYGILVSPKWNSVLENGAKPASTKGLPPLVHLITNWKEFPRLADADVCGFQDFVTYDLARGGFTDARCNGIEPLARSSPSLPPFLGPFAQPLSPPAIPPSMSIAK